MAPQSDSPIDMSHPSQMITVNGPDAGRKEWSSIRAKRVRRHAPERPSNLDEIREAYKNGTYVMEGWLAGDDETSDKPFSASERLRKDATFLVPQAPVRRSAALPPYARNGPSGSQLSKGRVCGNQKKSSSPRRLSVPEHAKELNPEGPVTASSHR